MYEKRIRLSQFASPTAARCHSTGNRHRGLPEPSVYGEDYDSSRTSKSRTPWLTRKTANSEQCNPRRGIHVRSGFAAYCYHVHMWLGIDVGTGSSRALLVDERGGVRAGYTALHEDIEMAHPQWAEQRPENWWDAVVEAIRGVLAKAGVSGAEVKAIGLSGQMHGLVILDEAHQVIRPSLIWCDQRSQAQVDFVNAKIGRENVLRYTANPVLTGFTLPKLLWVRDNEPANFERVRQMLLPKDYVRSRLTGEFATEVSDASGTSVFDVVKRRWSYELVDALGLDRAMLPVVYESSETSGAISARAAAATGLKAGTPV